MWLSLVFCFVFFDAASGMFELRGFAYPRLFSFNCTGWELLARRFGILFVSLELKSPRSR